MIDYHQEDNQLDFKEYDYNKQKIMQNKAMFLEAKLLFKIDNVKIDFEIR